MNAWIRPSFWRFPVESWWIGRSMSASKRSTRLSRSRSSTPPRRSARYASTARPLSFGYRAMSPGRNPTRRRISTLSRLASRPSTRAGARCRPDQVEQQAHRGRLAGAVRPEEAEHLTAFDLEIELEDPAPGSVVLRETDRRDDGFDAHVRAERLLKCRSPQTACAVHGLRQEEPLTYGPGPSSL